MSYRAAICDDSTTDAEFVGSILHQWAAERGIQVESEIGRAHAELQSH